MSKKKSKAKKKLSPPRVRRRDEAQHPEDILERITSTWPKAMGNPRTPEQMWGRLYGLSIGTLAAAKLFLRLVSGGELAFTGDPAVLDIFERESDQMADAHFEALKPMFPLIQSLPSILNPSEQPYLRLVRGRTDYHWSKERIDPDEVIPVPEAHLVGAQAVSDRVTDELMDYLVAEGKAAGHDRELALRQMASQVIALMAASKLILALHGNGKVAAFVEGMAEIVSEADYKRLREPSDGAVP